MRQSKDNVTRDDSKRRFLAQHSVATLLRHCFKWLQRCVELKIVVAIHPVQHHLKTESRCWKLISTRKQYAIPINIFDCDYTYNIILTPIIIT